MSHRSPHGRRPPGEMAELLERCTFPPAGTPVIAAVSGGPDSLAMLALSVEAGLAVTAVHVDHGLREGSAAEADIVAAAAKEFGAQFRAEKVSVAEGSDLEQRARQARQQVLGLDAMTGHTADDQAETLLINLMRGAGLAGLSAMEPGWRHPILSLRRVETVALCQRLGLQPVADPSNDDPRFVRNRVRHELLPLISDISSRDPVPLLNRTSDRVRQARSDIARMADGVDPTDTRALSKMPVTVAVEALRRWLADDSGHPPSSAEMERVLAVVRHEAVACEISGGRRVSRHDGVLSIEHPRSSPFGCQ